MQEGLASLVSSRICHDLISPIGAISNGVELMALSGTPPSPELSLLADSSMAATDTVKMLRLAFGPSTGATDLQLHEYTRVIDTYAARRSLNVAVDAPPQFPRGFGRLGALALMCGESCMGREGRYNLMIGADDLRIIAYGHLRADMAANLDLVEGHGSLDEVIAANVHFPMAREVALSQALSPTLARGSNELIIAFEAT